MIPCCVSRYTSRPGGCRVQLARWLCSSDEWSTKTAMQNGHTCNIKLLAFTAPGVAEGLGAGECVETRIGASADMAQLRPASSRAARSPKSARGCGVKYHASTTALPKTKARTLRGRQKNLLSCARVWSTRANFGGATGITGVARPDVCRSLLDRVMVRVDTPETFGPFFGGRFAADACGAPARISLTVSHASCRRSCSGQWT
mmetsp:Transcript_46422/g.143309  ORF Transcript_46422/g.143309 Transcript_46422/m.143309 type:complete len:203 (-) Transcript_46422:155-763(-)